MNNPLKKILPIFCLFGLAIISAGCGSSPSANTPKINDDDSMFNTNVPAVKNSNTNTNTVVVVNGQVFVKSYGTPSESYGVLLTDGREVGMGAYDSMKEQLRQYVGDRIEVTFSRICDPADSNCCRTVFTYCGLVKSWKPANTNK